MAILSIRFYVVVWKNKDGTTTEETVSSDWNLEQMKTWARRVERISTNRTLVEVRRL